MLELPPITRTIWPRRSRSRGPGEELIEAAMESPWRIDGGIAPGRHPGRDPGSAGFLGPDRRCTLCGYRLGAFAGRLREAAGESGSRVARQAPGTPWRVRGAGPARD